MPLYFFRHDARDEGTFSCYNMEKMVSATAEATTEAATMGARRWGRIVGGMFVALAITALATACEEEAPVDGARTVPVPDRVSGMQVTAADGTALRAVSSAEDAASIVDGLRAARPSFIEEPEPSGARYRLEMAGEDGSSTVVEVNDLRETNGWMHSGKVYANGAAWEVTAAWLGELLEGDAYARAAPFLRVKVDDESASVIVYGNRPIRTATVAEAMEATLTAASSSGDAAAPSYEIRWSDPYRFVVRFAEAREDVALRMRFDALRTAEGETFGEPGELYEAVVREDATTGRVLHVNERGEILRVWMADPATVLLQPVRDPGKLRLYLAGDRTALLDVAALELQAEPEPPPLNGDAGFGNDYGSTVLYSDRTHDDRTYVLHGNRTLYRVDAATGEAQPLYASEAAVYGMASSPSGERIALLVDAERRLSAPADLIVLDASGNVVLEAPQAAYVGHSDGFLFAYPLTWEDERTIVAPRIGQGEAGNGAASIDAADGTTVLAARPALPEAAFAIAQPVLEPFEEVLRWVPDPTRPDGRFSVETTNRRCWMIDVEAGWASYVGEGILLDWTPDGNVAIWDSPPGRTIHYIGW